MGSKGVDFGRLLETPTYIEEQSSSTPASRSNSRNPSITSLSSYMTNDTSKQPEPEEVIICLFHGIYLLLFLLLFALFFCICFQIAEMRTKGSVSGKVYAGYLLAGGNWCVVTLVFGFCVMAQSAASGGDFFISKWVNMEETSVSKNSIFYFFDSCRSILFKPLLLTL